jgi:hypothetical protein
MPTNNGPTGPYISLPPPPPPPPPPPLALYIPAGVTADANAEQRARIALVEIEFSHRVSSLLAKSYSEVMAILRDGAPRE